VLLLLHHLEPSLVTGAIGQLTEVIVGARSRFFAAVGIAVVIRVVQPSAPAVEDGLAGIGIALHSINHEYVILPVAIGHDDVVES
jgi:hypothetical protein